MPKKAVKKPVKKVSKKKEEASEIIKTQSELWTEAGRCNACGKTLPESTLTRKNGTKACSLLCANS